MDIRLSNNW